MKITKVDIDPEMHTWIKEEAKRQRRTIKGQVDLMLEMAIRQSEAEHSTVIRTETSA